MQEPRESGSVVVDASAGGELDAGAPPVLDAASDDAGNEAGTLSPRAPFGVIALYGSSVRVIPTRVTFHVWSSHVPEDAAEPLLETARLLKTHPEIGRISLHGYADRSEEPRAKELSVTRAEQVRAALIHLGVEPLRLTVVGHGAKDPLYGTPDEGRRGNPRVELRFVVTDP